MSQQERAGPLSPDRPAADRAFRVDAPFEPAGDQPEAIRQLVEGAQAVQVTLADKRQFDARLVGTDASTDLAVLKVDGEADFPVLPFGSSNSQGRWWNQSSSSSGVVAMSAHFSRRGSAYWAMASEPVAVRSKPIASSVAR